MGYPAVPEASCGSLLTLDNLDRLGKIRVSVLVPVSRLLGGHKNLFPPVKTSKVPLSNSCDKKNEPKRMVGAPVRLLGDLFRFSHINSHCTQILPAEPVQKFPFFLRSSITLLSTIYI